MLPYEEIDERKPSATKRADADRTGPDRGDAVVLAGVIERFDMISGDALVRIGNETIWVARWRIGA